MSRGFTLLELIVVLALLGLAVGIAAPNLGRLYDSISRTTERDHILDQLSRLADVARIEETNLVVHDSDAEMTSAGGFGDYLPHVVDVPDGWTLRLDEPLRVRASGVCLGATVTLTHRGGTSYQAALEAPLCRG